MKKIIFIFLILAMSVYAQNERIDINLAEYDPDTGFSKISVSNLHSVDLTNVKIKIDDSREFLLVDLLKSGGTVYEFLNVQSGSHTITITNDQGKSETKTLLFSKSDQTILKEIEEENKASEEKANFESELARLAEENKLETEVQIANEKQKNIQAGTYEESRSNKTLIFIIGGLIAGIGVIIWFIKGKK